jgi:hypothetical protein
MRRFFVWPTDSVVKQQMSLSVKTIVFWNVAPCSLVEVYRLFKDACCLHHQGDRPLQHLWNVGKLLSDYTAQDPISGLLIYW